MYASRISRILRSSYQYATIGVRSAQRTATNLNPEDEINRQANALGLLAQTPRIKLKIECFRKISKHLPSITEPSTVSEFIEVSSDDLKKFVKDSKEFLLTIVDENSNPPLMEVSHRPVRLPSTAKKFGIQADKGERSKTVQLRSNIDDHMLGVRVKQVEAFINAGHVTTIIVRLPKLASSAKSSKPANSERGKANSANQSDDNEELRLAQLSYNIQVKRFSTAFAAIPSASLQIINRPGLNEIALLLKPVQNK